jgi:glycosyltransferase involved in cell wall biosynthesis
MTTEYPPMINGGIANAVFGIVSASAHAGIEIDVVFIGDASVNKEYGNELSIPHKLKYEVTSKAVRVFLISWENAIEDSIRLIRTLKPEIVHLHTFSLFPIAYAIKKEIGTPIVYTVHAFERAHDNKNPLDYLLQSLTQEILITLVDRVIVLSQTEKELVSHYCKEISSRIRLVGNGTGTDPGFSYNQSRDPHLVLYSGRFEKNKGVEDLVAAIPYVVERYPDVNFVLVGGPLGTSREELQRQWLGDSFPCKNQVTFTGYVSKEELMKWYSKAGILVVPSSYDTFPLVILDGMQLGLAVVASSIGGALDIIRHGETGLLFTPRDIGSLVSCILMLLKDPALQYQLGVNAAKEIQNNWLWSNIVDRLLMIYREAIQLGRNPP